MEMRKTLTALVPWVTVIASCQPAVLAQRQAQPEAQPSFHYVILKTEVTDPDQPRIALRKVEVLMDEDSFSESNLTKLFALLSRRFPSPTWMWVFVKTSIKQVETPEQQDVRPPYDSKLEPPVDDCTHPQAFLSRDERTELIRYTTSPGSCKMTTMVIKGNATTGGTSRL